MGDLSGLPNGLDEKKGQCRVIIETPKDSRSKFAYDPESGLFELKALLPEGMVFPFDFGFIPSTIGGDGDPLDVLVLLDEPAHVGCLVETRLVGVIEAEQIEKGNKELNHRLLGVAMHSYSHQNAKRIGDLSETLLDQLEQFFFSYNKLHGKEFKALGRKGPDRAVELVREGIAAWEKK